MAQQMTVSFSKFGDLSSVQNMEGVSQRLKSWPPISICTPWHEHACVDTHTQTNK